MKIEYKIGQHVQILLAEDEREIRELVTLGLKLNAMTVDSVGDGCKAVEAARQQHYDMILLDMNMPHMNGLQAAVEIRALPCFTETPVLFLSGDDQAADIDLCNSGILAKPFTIRELVDSVHGLMDDSAEVTIPTAKSATT